MTTKEMNDKSKTIRTILENLFTDGYELGDSEITDCSVKPKAVDLALSDISKIIDEAVNGKKGEAIPYTKSQNNFATGYAICQRNIKSNLKERLG